MKLQNRIELLQQLKNYLVKNEEEWQQTKEKAQANNGWFTTEFIDIAIGSIIDAFLNEAKLNEWIKHYSIDDNITPKNVGIVMAGNIPLVGFHDFLCAFVCGHKQTIKLSSKDTISLKHLVTKMSSWNNEVTEVVIFQEMLTGCDAYIATGSNNSATYFDYYFSRYPSIIRRNRTSVAILTGKETKEELEKLSADIHYYFGLGCRNVTKLYVPEEYDFIPLLNSFHQYKYFADHHKYKNNYDYNLSIHIMNNIFYMTDEATLLSQNTSLFSPVSQVNYEFYNDKEAVLNSLKTNADVQCIVGVDIAFGKSQMPQLMDYADGVDTMQFLLGL